MNSSLVYSSDSCELIKMTKNFVHYYLHEFWTTFGDRRMKRFHIFSDGPYLLFNILLLYLAIVLKIIPKLMKNRSPLQLKSAILTYNSVLVVINLFYFVYEFIQLNGGIDLIFDLSIPTDDDGDNPKISFEANLYHFYYLTKIFDLMDTIFFALRKKTNQITFLHLYHHCLVATLGWLGFWYRFNSKPIKLFVLCNSFVHSVMYTYYSLSALGPHIQPYLWWKKYITQMQLIQFTIFISYGVYTEYVGVPYPLLLKYFTLIQSPIFFFLFVNFYIHSYKTNKSKRIIENNNNKVD